MFLQDLNNCVAAVQDCLQAYPGTGTPPKSYFENIKPGMTDSITRAHSKRGLGGWEGFMQLCKLTPLRMSWGTGSDVVDDKLREYVKASDTPHLMPKRQELVDAKIHKTNPHWRKAGALCVAIHVRGKYKAAECLTSCFKQCSVTSVFFHKTYDFACDFW